MEFFLFIFLSASILVTLVLILTFRKIKLQYKDRLDVVEEAISQNYNARVLRKPNDFGRDFDFKLNELIEDFQKQKIDYEKKEISRKRQLSSIAHDLRTPLTSIIGYLDASLNGIADDEKQKEEFIRIAYEKSIEIKRFTDELFELAKLDSDEMKINIEMFDMNEMLRGILIQFIPLLKVENIELKTTIPDEKYTIFFDKYSLRRIVQNVFQNAVQHGKRGGVIGVDVLNMKGFYRVCIWDKGKGIPEDKIDFIFDRLFRVDDSRKSDSTNYGLGLAITKKLIDMNNAIINVYSMPGEKTSFEIDIIKK